MGLNVDISKVNRPTLKGVKLPDIATNQHNIDIVELRSINDSKASYYKINDMLIKLHKIDNSLELGLEYNNKELNKKNREYFEANYQLIYDNINRVINVNRIKEVI